MTLLIAAPAPAGAAMLDGAKRCAFSSIRLPATGALERTAARFAAGQKLRILAIGSSSTEGVGASSPSFAYPAQLERELEIRFPGADVEVVNAGIGGETSAQTLARLVTQLKVVEPDLVLWQVGTNDALTASVTEKDFVTIVEKGVDLIEAAGADLVLVDQQYFKKVKDVARYERFVSVLEKVAREERICLFPRYKIMKAWDTAGTGRLETMLASDGFHMNDQGYACVADLLATQIQEIVTIAEP